MGQNSCLLRNEGALDLLEKYLFARLLNYRTQNTTVELYVCVRNAFYHLLERLSLLAGGKNNLLFECCGF